MCYAKPGLRCAYHAQEKVAHYQAKIAEKATRLANENLTPSQTRSVQRSISNFSNKLEEAQLEYGLTDNGFRELKRKHAKTKDPALGEKIKEYNLLRKQRTEGHRAFSEASARTQRADPTTILRKTASNGTVEELEEQVKQEESKLSTMQDSLLAQCMSKNHRIEALKELGDKTGVVHGKVQLARFHLQLKKDLIREASAPIAVEGASWSGQYRDGVEYDYDMSYHCSSAGCNDEGICRCGTIENARVTEVDSQKFLSNVYKRRAVPEEISNYADHVGVSDTSNWDVGVTGGYYGEEVSGVDFANDRVRAKVEDKINSYNYRTHDPQAVAWSPNDEGIPFKSDESVICVDRKGIEHKGFVTSISPFKVASGMNEVTIKTAGGRVNDAIIAVYR